MLSRKQFLAASAAGSAAVTTPVLTWRTGLNNGTYNSSTTTYDYGNISIGTASSDRYVIAHMTGFDNFNVVSAPTVTFDGNSPDEIQVGSGALPGGWAWKKITSGTTTNIKVNYGQSLSTTNGLGVWTATSLNVGDDVDNDFVFSSTAAALSVSSSTSSLYPTIMMGVSISFTAGRTWTNLTEDYDITFFTGASDSFAANSGAQTISTDNPGTANALWVLSFH